MRPLVVLACGAQKRAEASAALELYTGPLFASARRWALSVTTRDRIFILSARHALVRADEVLEPYDQEMTRARAAELVNRIGDQADELGLLRGPVYFAGGELYRCALLLAGVDVRAVAHALPPGRTTRGIGAQRSWYAHHLGQLPEVRS